MTPAIAVIIAAYNPGRYLRETIDSVLAQEFTDWEAVVVDDGSREPPEWVAAVDPRITLRRQVNAGVAAARNAGAAATTAPLLTFLDQDDLWLPGYLTAQVEQLADGRVDIASTAFEIVDADGRHVGPGYAGFNSSYAELLRGDGLQCGTVAVRRTAFERVGGFRDYEISADWDLWLRMLRDGAGISRRDDILGRWRQHDTNASLDYRGLWHDGRTILAQHAHPAARDGRRRVRQLAGAQAFDAARRDPVHHLAWALWLAPGYTSRALLRAALRPARRSNHRGARPPAPTSPDNAPNQP